MVTEAEVETARNARIKESTGGGDFQDVRDDLEHGTAPSGSLDGSDEKSSQDPNIINWDGPDDPMNPLNWPTKQKFIIVATISFVTLLTYEYSSLFSHSYADSRNRSLGSSLFAPAVPQVMNDFHSTNLELASFVVSVYLLGYTFGPLLIAPLSELYGRRPVYNTCNSLYVVFSVACALSPSLGSLVVFRFFAGATGSAPLAIGAGSLADMIRLENRGTAMAVWALGVLLGPVIGPVGKQFILFKLRFVFLLTQLLYSQLGDIFHRQRVGDGLFGFSLWQ
jgi:MFS family permease